MKKQRRQVKKMILMKEKIGNEMKKASDRIDSLAAFENQPADDD